MQSVNRKSDLSGFKLNPKISLFKNKLLKTSILAGFGSLIVFIATNEISKISEDLIIKDVGIIFALMMLIIPFTLFQLSEVKRKDNIDKNMPMFLLGLVSAVQSGSNLIKAIELMADRNLGTLTPELKNLRANISWGIPIEDALETFAKRTGTKVTRRVTTLLEIAVKIGGDVAENLEMIQKHVSEMQNIEKNRKSALSPYTYTIYISFFVFMFQSNG